MGFKLRKGDEVVIIAGDDKGKRGRIVMVDEAKRRVIVENVNMVKRHTKARSQNQTSGIIEKEAPVHMSNVQLFDAKSGKGVRVGVRVTKDGKRERISRASGEPVGKSE